MLLYHIIIIIPLSIQLKDGIEYNINEGTTSIPRELSGKCERKFIAGGTANTRIPISPIIASPIA